MSKRALVLSGGGVKGAFQAGVVSELARLRGGGWDVVCGVSAGALNSVMVARGALGDMVALWRRQAEKGMPAFRSRLHLAALAVHAIAPGILTYLDVNVLDGIYDNKELRELIEPHVVSLLAKAKKGEAPVVRIGVVCLQTGEYVALDPATDVDPSDAVDLVLASTAIPLAFDPVELTVLRPGLRCSGKKLQFVDGGARNITPVADAIDAAREAGVELEGVDVVMCSPLDTEGTVSEFHGLLKIGLRAEDILVNEIYRNDIKLFRRANALAAVWRVVDKVLSENPTDATALSILATLQAHKLSLESYKPLSLRLIRPTLESWREFTGRGDADLVGEFPDSLDRNGELLLQVVEYGMWLAAHEEHHLVVEAQ